MKLLAIKNLMFIILKPGLVVGLFPFLLLRSASVWKVKYLLSNHYLGIIVFAFGLLIMLHCIYKFIVEGKGTLSPIEPTKKLVIKGLYKFSRNPMYLGVLIMLIGEVIFSKSITLLIYLGVVFIVFNLYIYFFEEPRLKKDFGNEYFQYRNKVRRWI